MLFIIHTQIHFSIQNNFYSSDLSVTFLPPKTIYSWLICPPLLKKKKYCVCELLSGHKSQMPALKVVTSGPQEPAYTSVNSHGPECLSLIFQWPLLLNKVIIIFTFILSHSVYPGPFFFFYEGNDNKYWNGNTNIK